MKRSIQPQSRPPKGKPLSLVITGMESKYDEGEVRQFPVRARRYLVAPMAVPLYPDTMPKKFLNEEARAIYEEQEYAKAMRGLERIHADARLVPTLIQPLRALILKIKSLKGKEPTKNLKEAAIKTVIRLTRPQELSHKVYSDTANTMRGHSSRNVQILGGLMMALGLAIAALGAVFLPLLAGGALALTGIGLFAYHRKPHGLAKAMMNVNLVDGSGPIFANGLP